MLGNKNLKIDEESQFAPLMLEVGDLLHQVIDPEVGLDIMTMGLVYEIKYEEEDNTIWVIMTLTTKSCPMGPMITDNISQVVQGAFPEKDLHIHLVWEPAWSIDMITEEGMEQLGYY